MYVCVWGSLPVTILAVSVSCPWGALPSLILELAELNGAEDRSLGHGEGGNVRHRSEGARGNQPIPDLRFGLYLGGPRNGTGIINQLSQTHERKNRKHYRTEIKYRHLNTLQMPDSYFKKQNPKIHMYIYLQS